MSAHEILDGAMLQVQRDCADVLGAVVATGEGLVLASLGELGTDTSAAAAAYLAENLDRNLSLVLSTSCTEALLWTPAHLWGLARLPASHVLLLQAKPQCSAGTLRLALVRLRKDIGPTLTALQSEQVP